MTRSAETQQLSIGVLAHSRKANERRLPIHPAHFSRIDRRFRPRIFVEHGYGAEFGATDDALAELVGGIRTREQLIAGCAIILLPKVKAEDLTELNVGQVVWGWPHCVQDSAMTHCRSNNARMPIRTHSWPATPQTDRHAPCHPDRGEGGVTVAVRPMSSMLMSPTIS